MTTLRLARSTDAGTVGAILSEFVDKTAWMPRIHTRAEDLAHAARMIDFGWVTVSEQDGDVLEFAARNSAEINALYVAQTARGSGIGAVLLSDAQANSERLDLWTFQANTGAQRFYLRHGFSELSRTDGAENDEKLPDIRLVWNRKDT
jgi:GNAT superfamily N-acetyltransferase